MAGRRRTPDPILKVSFYYIDLHPDDRLDPRFFTGLVKGDSRIQIGMVRHSQRFHSQLCGSLHQLLHSCRPVEQTVFRMHMQMHKGGHLDSPFPAFPSSFSFSLHYNEVVPDKKRFGQRPRIRAACLYNHACGRYSERKGPKRCRAPVKYNRCPQRSGPPERGSSPKRSVRCELLLFVAQIMGDE